jgi:hypothetical protein
LLAAAAVLGVVGFVAVRTTGGAPAAASAAAEQQLTAFPTSGLPPGVPPAARQAQPALAEPSPAQWPLPAGPFAHTEGATRLDGGALYWTGFLYGDHGAKGIPVDTAPPFGSGASLSPPVGTYVYPPGPADGNGANLFGAAVGLAHGRTWWRVDWLTLADPTVPIAEWALHTGAGPTTSVWPANAGVHSPGEQQFLVVSSRGAWLIDPAGTRTPVAAVGGTLSVDPAAKSFIVSLPDTVLPPTGSWQVRLVAGLANLAGDGFATVPAADGAAPGQPNVYDVGFRTTAQEPPRLLVAPGPDPAGVVSAASAVASTTHLVADDNFWMDGAQATALARGTVAPFSATVDWPQLQAHLSTAAPHPTGFSDRWYVSTQSFGPGVSSTASQVAPNLLGAVQPYGIYVPTGYRPGTPTPLTFLLHSLDVNLNQYAVLDPRQVQQACQQRGSICVTPESRGLAGWYQSYAEVDFWQVWHAVASRYSLDPTRTVLSGYSMGGYGTYQLGLEYPDLFAGAVSLSGPPVCGIRALSGIDVPAGGGECTAAGDTAPLVGNARWLPFVIEQGVADELVPVTGVTQQVQLFDQQGLRYRYELYPAEDHLVNATQDGFRSEYRAIGDPTLAVDPGTVDFTWYPAEDQRALGIGPTGDYWVQGLRPAQTSGLCRVEAVSGERPEPAITVERHQSVDLGAQPTPRVTTTLSWVRGATPAPNPTLRASFNGVATATVELAAAGFAPGTAGTAIVTTTVPLTFTVAQLAPGATVRLPGGAARRAGTAGTVTVHLLAGTTTVAFG